MEVRDISALGSLRLDNPDNWFVPDSSGNFAIAIHVARPGYFRIGRNVVYLSPQDSIYMLLDYNSPEAAIFSGDAAAENMYLRNTTYVNGGSYCTVNGVITRSYEKTIEHIVSEGKVRKARLLEAFGKPSDFVSLEMARIRADIVNSFFTLSWYFAAENGLPADSAKEFELFYKDKMDSLIAPYATGFVSADYLQLEVYQGIAGFVAQHNRDSDDVALVEIKSWLAARKLFVQMSSPKRKKNLSEFTEAIEAISVSDYKNELVNVHRILQSYGVGDLAFDFDARDLNLQAVRLSDLKGKIILVDIWASWCGPCIEAFPQIEKLKEFFKADSSVIVLSLSIDDNKEKWLKAASKYGITEFSWIADRALLEPYRIAAIPRIILIDAAFRIHSFTGLQPEDFNGMKTAIMVIKQTTMGN